MTVEDFLQVDQTAEVFADMTDDSIINLVKDSDSQNPAFLSGAMKLHSMFLYVPNYVDVFFKCSNKRLICYISIFDSMTVLFLTV